MSTFSFQGIERVFTNLVSRTSELDSKMVDLQIASGYSRDEINQIIEENGLVPYIDPGSNEYVRVFRSGRLCSKNRYELPLNDGSSPYDFPRVQMLEKMQ